MLLNIKIAIWNFTSHFISNILLIKQGFLDGQAGKESGCNAETLRKFGFDPWVREDSLSGKHHPL